MTDRNRRRIKRTVIALLLPAAIGTLVAIWFNLRTAVQPPEIKEALITSGQPENPEPGFFRMGNNWLKLSRTGLWEMYLEGGPFERGAAGGKLARPLIAAQEHAFTGFIRELIPSAFYLRFLKYFIYWFNRDLDQYISEEYRKEIYGFSLSAAEAYSYIGTGYRRMLNYHSAHDVGHALQDYSLVGCTSFGVWGSDSEDGSLIVGRNFDFYAGDEFARNKIVCFEKPDSGHAFMMVTWAGMIGVVSGMNEKGLTVTINAAKSAIPSSARTPVSLVAREILQYAGNIGEAYAIASKRETFVSESFFIGSAADRQAAIIEKSPWKTVLVRTGRDRIICANHFQSREFSTDPLNILNKRENASVYRAMRLEQDIEAHAPMDYRDVASVLRDRKGWNGQEIGMGNEKAVNQLIAHHSVIFMPEKLLAWVSTSPWQIGPYVCYNLSEIFHNFAGLPQKVEITAADREITSDPFFRSPDYLQFMRFREMRRELTQSLRTGKMDLKDSFFEEFRASNPEYYEVYSLTGDYYAMSGRTTEAETAYRRALSKTVPRWTEKEKIIGKLAGLLTKEK